MVVENIEVPVRVFDGKKPVSGLTKEDFEITVGGKKIKINGFYEVRKKLSAGPSAQSSSQTDETGARHRLFVLIFNISDYQLDIVSRLDTLFDNIIHPGDHLIVITNRYFFPEWKVTDPGNTKKKIQDILKKEESRLKADMLHFRNDLASLAATLKSRMEDPLERKSETFPLQIVREFFMNYEFILDDIMSQYFSIPLERYIRIAGYLKGLQSDKWVLNFYQLGRIPILDSFGDAARAIDMYTDQSTAVAGNSGPGLSVEYPHDPRQAREVVERFQSGFMSKIYETDHLLVKDISKAFLNSGATFHTLLMKPLNKNYLTESFKFEAVSSDSENILKKLARLTGGSIIRSNKVTDFIEDITLKEDIIYMLTYVPGPRKKKPSRLKVTVNQPGYRLVFDDQERYQALERMTREVTREMKSLEIESLACNGKQVTVKLRNMEMVNYEGESFGAVNARIKIMDKRSKVIAGFEKTYKGINEQGVFQAQLPPLAAGKYKVVLEVRDIFSLKNVFVGDAVYLVKNEL
ncbi:MAG: hypothetical protein GY950_20895 [bacterium]|nr:hypothetical protein [bacterium]